MGGAHSLTFGAGLCAVGLLASFCVEPSVRCPRFPTLYSLLSTLYTLLSTLYTLHSTLYSLLSTSTLYLYSLPLLSTSTLYLYLYLHSLLSTFLLLTPSRLSPPPLFG
ncbi:hypothetical protein F3P21_07810 [Paenibacillus glucanolyticus]|nr:hypothetical protein [Paenibacillus glucanolyticus]